MAALFYIRSLRCERPVTDPENSIQLDWQRRSRTGLPEVVFAESKSSSQLLEIARQVIAKEEQMFFTRVNEKQAATLFEAFESHVRFHAESRTLCVSSQYAEDTEEARSFDADVAIVAAGTSDAPVVAEIEQTLLYMGRGSTRYMDVGVAGLWRLTNLLPTLEQYRVVIAVAGMEGALFSVLGGLIDAPIIAVPTSVGYGVGSGGHVALNAALCGCSPGLAVVNIDNGFGAATLAVKMLKL